MTRTHDEIVGYFASSIAALDTYNLPRPPTREELKKIAHSGESEWPKPDLPKMEEQKYMPSVIIEPSLGPVERGETEWGFEPENTEKTEEPEKLERPEEKEIQHAKMLRLIKEDPIHVLTNLMPQRDPKMFRFVYPLAKSVIEWVEKNKVPLDRDGIVLKETKFMLDLLEEMKDRMEKEKETGE